MRTTVTLDEDRLETASELTGITSRSELLRVALDALIAREASRRLALLGGSDPNAEAAPRRRSVLPDGTRPPEAALS
ncbi:MAG: type II toxin-antitoxin system VapB family antitoxin [Litorimonas sp.]